MAADQNAKALIAGFRVLFGQKVALLFQWFDDIGRIAMDSDRPVFFNAQAADARRSGLVSPRPEELGTLIQNWTGPRPLRLCGGGTTSRAAVADHWTLVGLLAFSGALGRTLYTGGRTLQAALGRRPCPWVALGIGVLPVIGNAAFPIQLLAATRGQRGLVARFLVHDIISGLGRRLPIWGGADTLAEHTLNDLAGWLCGGGVRASVRPLRGAPSPLAHVGSKVAAPEALDRAPSLVRLRPESSAPMTEESAPRR